MLQSYNAIRSPGVSRNIESNMERNVQPEILDNPTPGTRRGGPLPLSKQWGWHGGKGFCNITLRAPAAAEMHLVLFLPNIPHVLYCVCGESMKSFKRSWDWRVEIPGDFDESSADTYAIKSPALMHSVHRCIIKGDTSLLRSDVRCSAGQEQLHY